VERLIRKARPHLASGGLVALEIGHDQAARVAALFAEEQFSGVTIPPRLRES